MDSVYLWAQSLDNSSPDYIYHNGRILKPQKDSNEREEILSSISQVTINSKPQKVENNILIYINNDKFVLSIVLPEQDVLYRKAPILCYSSLADPEDKLFSQRLIAHISNFTRSIGRSFPSNLEQEVKLALSLVKKKPTIPTTLIWILAVLFLLPLLLLFLFIFLIK